MAVFQRLFQPMVCTSITFRLQIWPDFDSTNCPLISLASHPPVLQIFTVSVHSFPVCLALWERSGFFFSVRCLLLPGCQPHAPHDRPSLACLAARSVSVNVSVNVNVRVFACHHISCQAEICGVMSDSFLSSHVTSSRSSVVRSCRSVWCHLAPSHVIACCDTTTPNICPHGDNDGQRPGLGRCRKQGRKEEEEVGEGKGERRKEKGERERAVDMTCHRKGIMHLKTSHGTWAHEI